MGTGITYHCPNCGYRKGLHHGAGFKSFPMEETRVETLKGEFGKEAQRIAREHPDAQCSWYRPLFRCACGYYSVKDSVSICNEEGSLYSPSMRCCFCHRKMTEVDEVDGDFRCPKCGTVMEETDFVCWD